MRNPQGEFRRKQRETKVLQFNAERGRDSDISREKDEADPLPAEGENPMQGEPMQDPGLPVHVKGVTAQMPSRAWSGNAIAGGTGWKLHPELATNIPTSGDHHRGTPIANVSVRPGSIPHVDLYTGEPEGRAEARDSIT